MKQFTVETDRKGDHPAALHLLNCFALIAAAGCLGVRYGTLPWTEEFVFKCIKRCYRDARRQLRTEDDLLRGGLHILKEGLASTKLLNVTPGRQYSKASWATAEGYREKTTATIAGGAFKAWFSDQRQAGLVLRWLHSKNAVASKRRPSGTATAISWAESQPQWPDGSRRRSIVIDLRHDILADVAE